ncbi:helix-turn-helix domain-containing protein [Sphingomonas japonica]|uniref:HTH cro/C1-type domain-containing protein n=1 Tax=Sphingomonas japonica TaxID=511662 RepID=A0ABX0U7R4_9SPHN|nr:helix-turn-helix transcriptional regulator [Sphingomonas japonica]NIJ24813.1 hypothetical protein [Sphingomonas japonica]
MALRNATMVQRHFTVEQVAATSGVPVRTVRSYMANDETEVREPTLSNALSIACVLGPVAVNGVLALIGYGGAKPLDEPDAIQPMQIVATGMQHFAVIAEAAADNRIDHTEEQRTTEAADGIIATFLPLSSAGRAK